MNLAAARYSYDQLHYVGRSYLQTHPERLAALGQLHGMRPAPVERCRVLELACGDGNNLIPMAYALPESTFLGQDLAAGPLAVGQEHIATLGLSNVKLEAGDLMDFPADAGEFDYIIAHGFYSWCPAAVRDKILAVCGTHLAPQGIAFVSFNTYPGYHQRDLQRQLMLYHLAHARAGSPAEQATQAMGALEFVARSQPENDPYRVALQDAREHFAQEIAKGEAGLAWFHHDLLATHNHPVYFHEFMDHAGGHGLQYVCDALLRVPRVLDLPPDTLRALQAMNDDVVIQEQYLDFVLCAQFRQALLCRAEVALDRSLGPGAMRGLRLAGNLSQSPTANPGAPADPDAPETFTSPHGEITLKHQGAKEVLRRISAAWPGSASFAELLEQPHGGTAAELAEFILRICVGKFAAFRLRASASALALSERPEASAVARLQAETGPAVTTMYHDMAMLAVPARRLLRWLDGTRDRADLLREMRAWIASGQAAEDYRQAAGDKPGQAAEKSSSPPTLETLEADMDASLQAMVRMGVLVG